MENDARKTKAQLITEIEALRQQVRALQAAEAEHQQAEEARRESEERYRTLIEHTYDFVIESSSDGRFLYLSSGYKDALGYDPTELLGRNIFELMHPDDIPAALTAFTRGVAAFSSDQAVFRYRHKNGEWLWFESTGRPFRTATGDIRVLVVSRDITERKRADEARQEEAQISAALARVGREMISSLDTPIILHRLCQLTTQELECDCNHTFLWHAEKDAYVPMAQWGDTLEQWETLRVLTIPRQAVDPLLARLQEDEVTELLLPPQDLLSEVLSRRCGLTGGLYLALRRGADIIGLQSAGYRGRTQPFSSKQQRMARGIAQIASMALENARLFEQAQSANRLKSDFVATMSHELRTPLHVIMGYTELLLEEGLDSLTEEQVHTLQRIEHSAKELYELITAMLDLSRLETGRFPVETRAIDMAQLIEDMKRETRDLQRKAGLAFTWRVAPGLPPVHTDPTKLKVILKNLIENAVKFTEAGRVTVAVDTHNGHVDIAVTDTGIGIAPEALSIIFEPFRQIENPLTRQYRGVGLGLYVVRRMLELLGGTISVTSTLGQGSTFRVRLPLQLQWDHEQR